ncbi:MAG TPA: hypothetical protein VGS41_09705 [Chthonomonadales bacterium]|nr:hypothetical protein [Chthonomonadales bacterium]
MHELPAGALATAVHSDALRKGNMATTANGPTAANTLQGALAHGAGVRQMRLW